MMCKIEKTRNANEKASSRWIFTWKYGAVNFTLHDSGHKSRESLARFHRDPIDFPHGEKFALCERIRARVSLNRECIISRLVKHDVHGVLKVARFLLGPHVLYQLYVQCDCIFKKEKKYISRQNIRS